MAVRLSFESKRTENERSCANYGYDRPEVRVADRMLRRRGPFHGPSFETLDTEADVIVCVCESTCVTVIHCQEKDHVE